MKTRAKFLLAGTLFASASLAQAADVRTDYDHGVNFANYHTYSWGNVETSDPLYVNRIKNEVNRDLQAKGWQLVPSGGNATVFANGSVKNEQQVETYYNNLGGGWGGGWGWGGWGGGWGGGFGPGGFGEATSTTSQQPVGHLVLDIFDSSNHTLLFRGVSNSNVKNNSEKNTKSLDKDINKMLSKFPPKANT